MYYYVYIEKNTLLSSLGSNPAVRRTSTQGSWFIAAAIIKGVIPSFLARKAADDEVVEVKVGKLCKSMDNTVEYPHRAAKKMAEVPSCKKKLN